MIFTIHKYKIDHCVCVYFCDVCCNASNAISPTILPVISKITNILAHAVLGVKKHSSARWRFRAVFHNLSSWTLVPVS